MLLSKRLWAAVAAVLFGGLSPVKAQTFRTVPNAAANYYPSAWGNAALSANLANPANRGYYVGGYYPPEYSNPYYPTTVYAPTYDPYGGYLSGGADIIRAQGDLQNQLQQAKITKQQAEQAKLDTRRKAFDQYLYERANRPTAEDDREKARLEAIRRARNQPPLSEIWSGQALNILMDSINKMQAQGVRGPTVPLDPDVLRKINVKSGAGEGNPGLLRDGGRLSWPLMLRTSAYKTQRQRLDKLSAAAYKQLSQGGAVEADTVIAMQDAVNKLFAQLKRNIQQIPVSDYMTMRRYLSELGQSVTALENDPNVGNYVTGKWSARGDTVADLVQNMTAQGLRFAPATHGNENAYTALHSAMVAYYVPASPYRPWDPAAK
jgi:hypothetical protein